MATSPDSNLFSKFELDALKGLAKFILKREASVASSVSYRFRKKISFLQKKIGELEKKVKDFEGEGPTTTKIYSDTSPPVKEEIINFSNTVPLGGDIPPSLPTLTPTPPLPRTQTLPACANFSASVGGPPSDAPLPTESSTVSVRDRIKLLNLPKVGIRRPPPLPNKLEAVPPVGTPPTYSTTITHPPNPPTITESPSFPQDAEEHKEEQVPLLAPEEALDPSTWEPIDLDGPQLLKLQAAVLEFLSPHPSNLPPIESTLSHHLPDTHPPEERKKKRRLKNRKKK